MKIFYFTATGNSLYIARKFVGAELYSIPQVLRGEEREFADDKIGIVFPVYGFAIPRSVRDFITNVKLKSDYVFAIGTYGNMPGNSCGWLETFAQKHGLRIDYANHILMADNYLPMFDAKKEREKDVHIEENAAARVRDVEASRRFVNGGGIAMRALTWFIQLFWNKMMGVCRKFKVRETCVSCGVCSRVCPNLNIEMADGKPKFGQRCENCFACIQLCPAKAITLPREKNPDERYRHPDVSVADISRANTGQ